MLDSVQKSIVSGHAVGLGLRYFQYADLLEQAQPVDFVEVHPENYFGGGPSVEILADAAALYPVSLHGVGLSLGSPHALDVNHLKQLKYLNDLIRPFHVSDHASWSAFGNAHSADLLPLPYTENSLDNLCRNVDQAQQFLGRRILVENPSIYLEYKESTMSECEFLNRLAARTGCGLLLDINNIYVNHFNHGWDAGTYIDAIAPDAVGQYHLAGHSQQDFEGGSLKIDTHNQPVCDPVWDLYAHALRTIGAKPTLIEWDKDLPEFAVLLDEVSTARDFIRQGGLQYAA